MKKIIAILPVFIFFLSISSYAQVVVPSDQQPEHLEHYDNRGDFQKPNAVKRKRTQQRLRHRYRAHKRQMRAMRRVARADGQITQRERAVMRSEKRKMKRKAKRRAIERRQNRTQAPPRNQGGGF